MKAAELKDRTKKFAVAVMKLVEELPRSSTGRTIASPLMRCGTAVGATYRSACRARNRYEFTCRIAAVEEAADESCYWFEIILEAGLLSAEKVEPLLTEGQQLKKIFTKSRKTAVRIAKERAKRDGGPGFVDDDDIPF